MRAAPTLLCLVLSAAASAADHRQHARAAEGTTGSSIPIAATPTASAAPDDALGEGGLAAQQAASVARARRARAAPWIALGAGALAAGGAALWWDGAQISDDLHARFAAGDLTAADGPRYGRARRESIAGRAMVAGAAVLGAVAVALWW